MSKSVMAYLAFVSLVLAGLAFGFTFLHQALDHDDFGLNQSKIINVIDSKSLERDAGGKPGSTFPKPALATAREPRLALVIGNGDYAGDPLATAVNDAGLVADALRAADFEVSGAANLDQDAMRRAF